MLGLEKGKITLVQYSEDWPKAYEAEKAFLQSILADRLVEIYHTGSTSIPGMAAKPIIDILAGVRSLCDLGELQNLLASCGYLPTDLVDNPYHKIFSKGNPVTHHLHVVEGSGLEKSSHPGFRDRLIQDAILAREYLELKRELAKKFPNDADAYARGKNFWISRRLPTT